MSQISSIGDEAWQKLSDFFEERKLTRVLLVIGKSSYERSGAAEKLKTILASKDVTTITGFDSNPKADDVVEILAGLAPPDDFDVILAVGGGSVIDVAKLIKAYWRSSSPVCGHLEGIEELSPCIIPLAAVPTTAGSGSEATHFAVVYVGKEKFSVAHKNLLPEFAGVDPSLLISLPRHIAAASSMDALCQAIESCWSIHSTEESEKLAIKAIELAWQSIEAAVNEKDSIALTDIATASHFAGKAINITKTTAPHAVSYALTSYFGVTHGHGVGLLVPEFLKFNEGVSSEDCLDARGPERVKKSLLKIARLLNSETVEQTATSIQELMNRIGLKTKLSELGVITEEDIGIVLDNGFNPNRINNNPRRVSRCGLQGILKECL